MNGLETEDQYAFVTQERNEAKTKIFDPTKLVRPVFMVKNGFYSIILAFQITPNRNLWTERNCLKKGSHEQKCV